VQEVSLSLSHLITVDVNESPAMYLKVNPKVLKATEDVDLKLLAKLDYINDIALVSPSLEAI
jgi:hypothetical protein